MHVLIQMSETSLSNAKTKTSTHKNVPWRRVLDINISTYIHFHVHFPRLGHLVVRYFTRVCPLRTTYKQNILIGNVHFLCL